MRRTTIGALTLATLPLLALTACSDDDTSDESTGATTAGTAMTDDTTMSDGTAMTDDTAMSDGACPDETVLTIANTDTDADGELEASWALADDGPGYSNGDDTNMELAFSDFDFPEDEQFGIQIPVGVPSDLPEGDTFVNISMFNPDETIAADSPRARAWPTWRRPTSTSWSSTRTRPSPTARSTSSPPTSAASDWARSATCR